MSELRSDVPDQVIHNVKYAAKLRWMFLPDDTDFNYEFVRLPNRMTFSTEAVHVDFYRPASGKRYEFKVLRVDGHWWPVEFQEMEETLAGYFQGSI